MTNENAYPVPTDDAVYLDHIGHFVPDLDAASDVLERMGFALTPFSLHINTDDPNVEPKPAGTANRLIMLDEGYLEILGAVGEVGDETPVAQQLLAQMERYVGVHLVAMCCADAEEQRKRLVDAGFPIGPAVDLRRDTEDADGNPDLVTFTVIRPRPGAMKEGRIQFLRHNRPDLMWQQRWMTHANGAQALTDIVICVADMDEADDRFRRYLDRSSEAIADGRLFRFERGGIALLDEGGFAAALPGTELPTVPFIAGYGLRSGDLGATKAHLEANGFTPRELGSGAVVVDAPAALGGTFVFTARDMAPPWRAS